MAEASKDYQRRYMYWFVKRDGEMVVYTGYGVRMSRGKLTKAAPPWNCHKVGAVGLVPQTLNLYL